ncbi:MAG: 2-dehydro-3-deoxygalactonokinase [Rhizobiales bacterium]|nr:2-dehydro-3-deoxygalactonokinase [Hyphomicrobiales bacterium]
MIGVDWGTSAFRATLLDEGGAVLDRRLGPHGIMTVTDGDFAGVLTAQIGDWLAAGRAPVILSGMIGSRQGWLEAPYLTCPAGIDDLAAALVRVPFEAAEAYIVPGVAAAAPHMRDVMRGEETQIFGALAELGATGGRFVLPGTHSKWVLVEAERIVGFFTYMTGEIYAACRNHTILGRLMKDGEKGDAAFIRGVADGARVGGPGALLNRLFGVRTAGLFGEVAGAGLADYLSGLLIGAEIADAGERGSEVLIIASDALEERYRAAAAALGIAARVLDSDLAIKGQLAIARMAGLVATDGLRSAEHADAG